MAEFTLPQNSKVKKGKSVPLSSEAGNTKKFIVYRYDPAIDENPTFDTFEIENPISRIEFLNKIGGIENHIYLKVGSERIISVPEQDLDRTSSEGKASSVQFIHFNFSENQIKKFRNKKVEAIIGIDHNKYSHFARLQESIRVVLSNDFY